MRRLVAISKKTRRAIMAFLALAIFLTSLHLAAAARIVSLRQQQERLEQSVSPQPSASSQSSAALENQKPVAVEEGSAAEKAAPARKRQIVISIADRKLALLEDGQVLKTYPIAVGTRGTPSPEGDFVIVNHARDPVYRHGDKEIPPGKDNPLGSRWMGLNLKGYGIHGTNAQSSVGKAVSHGCFRMRKQDVEDLYSLVRVGDVVTVRRERDAFIAQVFAAPTTPAVTLAVKSQDSGEAQVASASVTAAETAQE